MKILIKNGMIYHNKSFIKKDILIDNEKISEIKDNIIENDVYPDKIIDAQDKHIFPGFVDLHCHLREPGQTHKEDIYTGTRAAAKGGFTTICAMPNTYPVIDNIASVEFVQRKAKDIGLCKVKVIGASSKKIEGKEISEIATMKEGGIIAVSDDGACVQNAKLQQNIMKYARNFDLPVIIHAEDYNLAGKGQVHGGKIATRLGLSGIPGVAEELIIARDLMLAELTKCQIHIAHLSTAKSVQLVREAKANGIQVTSEVTPHHLIFNEDCLVTFDTNYKCKPPIRSEKDRQALLDGLIDGTIDLIATDHAPHSDYEKEKEFDFAPFGINGFETAFASLYTELVLNGSLSLEMLIEKMAVAPSQWLRLKSGIVDIDKPADLVIVDLNADINFTYDNMLSKSKNTPYLNKSLKAKVSTTICDGKITFEL
ncbi:MAG: dihydroorotase [Candidatus Cloacimonetes bacterium]|jgi:dihydroorotase|nr:dihydroorotase [Candidatus Cloacimonadota bacterium]